jgi:hypothetical protein
MAGEFDQAAYAKSIQAWALNFADPISKPIWQAYFAAISPEQEATSE